MAGCATDIPRTEISLTAVSTTAAYFWYTPFRPAIGIDKLAAVIKAKNVSGNFECRLALQTASVRGDSPDSPTQLESGFTTGASEHYSGVLDISSNTGSKLLVRFGICYALSSGTTPATADVALEGGYDACGQMVGSTTVKCSAPDTANYFEPVTDFLPCIHVDKVKAAIVVTSSSTNFQCRLAYRKATTSKESAGGWTTTFDSWHTGDGEFNTGELTPTNGSDMWIQFGIQCSMSSGTNGTAMVSTAVAIRRT